MVKLFTVCHDGITGSLLHVVVSFSLGSVSEVVECIQVYYTALYRPHGSTDITSKTMHNITLCIICNALYTTGQSAVAHWTLRSQSLGIIRDTALHVSCQSFSLLCPITSLTLLKLNNYTLPKQQHVRKIMCTNQHKQNPIIRDVQNRFLVRFGF